MDAYCAVILITGNDVRHFLRHCPGCADGKVWTDTAWVTPVSFLHNMLLALTAVDTDRIKDGRMMVGTM